MTCGGREAAQACASEPRHTTDTLSVRNSQVSPAPAEGTLLPAMASVTFMSYPLTSKGQKQAGPDIADETQKPREPSMPRKRGKSETVNVAVHPRPHPSRSWTKVGQAHVQP